MLMSSLQSSRIEFRSTWICKLKFCGVDCDPPQSKLSIEPGFQSEYQLKIEDSKAGPA